MLTRLDQMKKIQKEVDMGHIKLNPFYIQNTLQVVAQSAAQAHCYVTN